MSEFLRILPLVLPPLLGAVIGYVTNAIAIRMLFRPLTEKRILGVRVPFTPGIIPRQRGRLAESIGDMVSGKLLTGEAVREHLGSEAFGEGLHARVRTFTTELLEANPADGQGDTSLVVEGLQDGVERFLVDFLGSETFSRMLRVLIHSSVDRLSELQVRTVLGDRRRVAIFVADLLKGLPDAQAAVSARNMLREWLQRHYDQNTGIGAFIGDDVTNALTRAGSALYEPLFARLLEWMKQPEIRKELAERGRELLTDILNKLNIFQRFLVSAGQYDRALRNRMPEIVQDVTLRVRKAGEDQRNRERVILGLRDAIRSLRNEGVRDVMDRAGVTADALTDQLFAHIGDFFKREDVHERVQTAIHVFLEARWDSPLGEMAEGVSGMSRARIASRLHALVDNWLQAEGRRERLASSLALFVSQVGTGLRERPLGETLKLSPVTKSAMDSFISRQLHLLLDRKLPQMLEAFNVRTLVVNKINSLDVASVEQLLMMVIARHLKYINIFGAILGALIGGAQILVSFLTRSV